VTTITVNGQNNAIWPATNGAFVIEDEFISYASHAGGVFTGCTRGAGGTAAVSHDFGESVIHAVYWNNVNVVDVIYDILTTYCDIDPSYIPYNDNPADPDEWDDEKAAFLSGYNITRVLYEPIGAVAALTALCSQSYINLWYDPKRAKIRISATNTAFENTHISHEHGIGQPASGPDHRPRPYFDARGQDHRARKAADYAELVLLRQALPDRRR
jgi:hypothetical protein